MPRKPTRLNEISTRFQQKYSDKEKFKSDTMPDEVDLSDQGSASKSIDDKEGQELETAYLKDERIQFISSIDSKPVFPTYLRLMSLKNFIKLSHDQKQNQGGENGMGAPSQGASKQGKSSTRSIEKTEYDEIIK